MTVIIGGTTGIVPAQWTTAGRPSSPTVGQSGYNTTLGLNEYWNGSYWFTFNSSNTSTYTASYLIVAGGGSGGSVGQNSAIAAGGGGAGGLVEGTTTLVPGTAYSFVVGAGGAGSTTNGSQTANGYVGNNSTGFGLTVLGGGYGAGAGTGIGGSGGSGGG